MPEYTDPNEQALLRLLDPQPLRQAASPARVGTGGRCPTCHYLAALPCAVCAATPQWGAGLRAPSPDTPTSVGSREAPAKPCPWPPTWQGGRKPTSAERRKAKTQAIFAYAVAWAKEHPGQKLTGSMISKDPHFPFSREYAYEYWPQVAILSELAHAKAREESPAYPLGNTSVTTP